MSRQQIDFPVQQHHIATPAPPPAGALKLYPKSDNVLYKLTSAGVESAVGVIPDPLTVNNLTVNTKLAIGTGGSAGQIVPRGATNASLSIESSTQYLMLMSVAGTHVGGNIYWDGTNWQRFDVAQASGLYVASTTGHTFYTAAAAANPLTNLAVRMTIAPTAVTIPVVLTAAGGINVTAGAVVISNEWIRLGATPYGIYNNVAAQGIAFDVNGAYLYPGGQYIMGRNVTETISGKTHAGHFYMGAGGYIFGSYINMTADIAGGSPVYVAGQNGDNYLRWYPKSSVIVPLTQINGTVVNTSYPSGTSNTLLCYITATRTGYWAFAYEVRLNGPTSDHALLYAFYAGVNRFTSDTQGGGSNPWAQGFGGIYTLTAGQNLEIYGAHSYNGGYTINYQLLQAWFVPTPAYPG